MTSSGQLATPNQSSDLMKCTILNYGMGNLRSVQKAIEAVGGEAQITDAPEAIAAADRLLLPGVGAFGDAMTILRERGFMEPIQAFAQTGRPMLGICLGMQLVMSSSTEHAPSAEQPIAGLDLIPGQVQRFCEDQGPDQPRLKVPHMGWNAISPAEGASFEQSPLFAGIKPGSHVYFVHGYYVTAAEAKHVAATCDYGSTFCAAANVDNIWATQFHPEKSQQVGLKILSNYLAM